MLKIFFDLVQFRIGFAFLILVLIKKCVYSNWLMNSFEITVGLTMTLKKSIKKVGVRSNETRVCDLKSK